MPLVKWFFQVWSESGGGWSVTASCTASMPSGSWLQLMAMRSTALSPAGTWSTSTVSSGSMSAAASRSVCTIRPMRWRPS